LPLPAARVAYTYGRRRDERQFAPRAVNSADNIFPLLPLREK
jgi:hypothetical protein